MRTLKVLVDGLHGKKKGDTFDVEDREVFGFTSLGQAEDLGPVKVAEPIAPKPGSAAAAAAVAKITAALKADAPTEEPLP